jgi:hypothetical protein
MGISSVPQSNHIESNGILSYDFSKTESVSSLKILLLIKSEFPITSKESIIPLDKFKPYLDSIIMLYKNDVKESTVSGVIENYLRTLSDINGNLTRVLDIDISKIKEYINSIFDLDVDNPNETYYKLLQRLGRHTSSL